MLSKKQKEELLYSLSSFYRDFLPVDNQLMKLFDVYAKTIDYVWNVYGEVNDSRFVSTTRTLSTIPYFKVDINEAVYDLNTARLLARLSFEEQIAAMDKEGLFTTFVFNQKDNAGAPLVYGMRLFVDFSDKEPLRLYEDYFLRSNRLYLLPRYIQRKRKAVHYLHAFDIKVNDHTLEKNFGTRFNLEAGPLLPRYEYRDVLEAYLRMFRGEMTIKSLKEAMKLATKWETFKLEDMKSPDISKGKLKLYQDWIISPNKFLVTLPEELIPDKIKINILRALMSEIKEADKDYMVFFDIHRIDPNRFPMEKHPLVQYRRGEEMLPEDDSGVSLIELKFVDYPLDVAGRYDTAFFYNFNLKYDDPPANEIIGISVRPNAVMESPSFGDDATVTLLTSPRIPRNFKGTKNTTTGDITFSLNPNADETTQFQLLNSSSEFGQYTVVETIQNNKSATTLNFTHSAKESQKRYYKSRAVGPNKQSLMTLPINVDAL